MKQVTVFCVAMGVWMVSGVYANVEVFEICAGSAKQQNPAISGRYVVWQDERDGTLNQNIYAYDLETGIEFPVCTAPGHQRNAAICGDIIVWQDQRDGKWDIYGYDLSVVDPQEREFVISNHEHNQEYPAVSGRFVIWGDRRDGTLDLYGYDLQTGVEFEIASHSSVSLLQPAIWGDWVVWYDSRNSTNQVYGCRLTFPIPPNGFEVVHLSPSDNVQGFAAINGPYVVWQENRVGATGWDIVGVNLETLEPFEVCTHVSDQSAAAIGGDFVVWQDSRNAQTQRDIYGYSRSTGNEFVVSAHVANQSNPAASGRYVVWQQSDDIWGAYLPEPTTLTVVWPDDDAMLLAGGAFDIVWQTEGPVIDEVQIAFSHDDGQTWQVVEPNVPETGAYLWITPDVDSQACRVRVGDAGTTGAVGTSPAFTVFRCNPALTADLTGDCRVDIADFAELASQWLLCGNPYDPDWCWEH